VAEAVVTVQRDWGDRSNRKHARLKYTIEDRGLDAFRIEVENRAGIKLDTTKPFTFTSTGDRYGWTEGENGKQHLTLYIPNGRIQDVAGGAGMLTGLRKIAEIHKGDMRLTANQNVIIANVSAEMRPTIEEIVAQYRLVQAISGLRRNSIACVALPTCGLALTESERVLPEILNKFEEVLEEAGLSEDAISLRITGCPNGCARPFLAEIGFVGRAPNKYALYLGASYNGTRLSRLVSPSITIDDALELLRPVIKRYALERNEAEGFGDFCDRVILPENATIHSVGTPDDVPVLTPA
jgi:sulfite reductase (NADPH) hemoprotein beta-component